MCLLFVKYKKTAYFIPFDGIDFVCIMAPDWIKNLMKQPRNRVLIILTLFIISGFFMLPAGTLGDSAFSKKLSSAAVTLGLDLAGGTELDYKVDLSEVERVNNDDDPTNNLSVLEVDQLAESVRDALEQRVNPAGVAETIVKRSQVNGEEHILIQLPPSTNVNQVKADAERDNTLEFYEEDPELEAATRAFMMGQLQATTPQNWDAQVKKLTVDQNARGIIRLITDEKKAEGTFTDQQADLLAALKAAPENSILDQPVTTVLYEQVPLSQANLNIDLPDDMKNNSSLTITRPVGTFTGIVKLTSKETEETETESEKTVNARHILFAHPESGNDDTPYKTRDEALTKAEEILASLQDGDAEAFAAAAKEFSNGPSGVKGGDLGEITKGQMVPEFDAAIFDAVDTGLINEVIETQFGFHLIYMDAINAPEMVTSTYEVFTYEMIGWDENELRWSPTPLGGKQLEKAVVDFNEANQPQVVLLFDNEGKEYFSDLTKSMAARTCRTAAELEELGYDLTEGEILDSRLTACRLGIRVGGVQVSSPTVTEHIPSRQVLISGNFTLDQAKELANGLNLGAIDAPVSLSGQLSIQPELGAEQLKKSLDAAAIGFIIIMAYMIASYRMAGVIAAIALCLYGLLFFMILKLSGTNTGQQLGGPVVLSLAGVAGMVLSIGLAVDGNILIFERMREELARGKNLFEAVELGFKRAKTAIWDSNLTTLLVCIILFIFGKSVVRGFAITLIIGTILSLFTSLWVSAGLLRWLITMKWFQDKELYTSDVTKK